MTGDERFKSCAPLGGTGVQLHEQYNVDWMDQRIESLGQYITGEQRYKTELSTYNEFNGTFMLDAKPECARQQVCERTPVVRG